MSQTLSQISTQTGFAHLTDLPCLKLVCGQASAVISLYGAQLLSYQPAPGKELLWLSPKAVWQQQQAIRGGVPVCWPWFGPAGKPFNTSAAKLPNHGLVRNRLWRQMQAEQSAQHALVMLSIDVADIPTLNHSVTLNLTLKLTADTLTLQLDCAEPMLQQAALHSYFAVPSLSDTRVSPLPGAYLDKTLGGERVQSTEPLRFEREIDRVYPKPAAELLLQSGAQQLNISQQGQDATVVWNPWRERSKTLPDLAENSYQQFVCVETAKLDLDQPAALQLSQRLTSLT